MTGLIEALMQYVEEERAPKYIQTREYHQMAFGIEEHWEDFRATLTEEQVQKLDALLKKEDEVRHLEDRAVFSAALTVGLDLGRL